MGWECPCGVVNKNDANVCSGCGWTVERANEYFSKHPELKEKIEKKHKFLTMAWDAFKRARGIVILYSIILLFIKETCGLFISDSFWSYRHPTNSDFVVFGISMLLQSWFACGIVRVALDSVRGFERDRRRLITPLSDFCPSFYSGNCNPYPDQPWNPTSHNPRDLYRDSNGPNPMS